MSARLLPLLVLATALAGCTLNVNQPVVNANTAVAVGNGAQAQPPSFAGLASPPPTALPTGPVLPAQTGIQLIDKLGAASFATVPGKRLTVAASVGAAGATSEPLRLSVSPRAAYWADLPTVLDAGARPTRRLQQAASRTLGSEDSFWINAGDSSSVGDHQRACTLRRSSPNAYFYVDKASTALTEAQLDQLVTEWEQRIYPKLTAVFGQESKPGIDGESRVFVVLSPAVHNFGADKNLMGYFWSRDAIPGTSDRHSNQKEALFMTDLLFERPPLTSFGTLAHEFQHLINFSRKAARLNYRVAEETWLDEGLSMYAMDVAGYGLPAGDYHIAKDLRAFQEEPQNYTLTNWGQNPPGFAYGQSYLFVKYLVDRYGDAAIPAILGSDQSGVAAVEGFLKAQNTTFEAFFRDWAITNVVSGTPLAAGTPYSYKGLALTGTYKSSTGLADIVLRGFQQLPANSGDVVLTLKPWGTAYYAFDAETPRIWNLSLTAGTPGRLFGAAIVP